MHRCQPPKNLLERDSDNVIPKRDRENVTPHALNLFYGTTIAVNILVLSRYKTDIELWLANKLYKESLSREELKKPEFIVGAG